MDRSYNKPPILNIASNFADFTLGTRWVLLETCWLGHEWGLHKEISGDEDLTEKNFGPESHGRELLDVNEEGIHMNQWKRICHVGFKKNGVSDSA